MSLALLLAEICECIAQSTRIVMLNKNIHVYTLWSLSRLLLPLTYIRINFVYPFLNIFDGYKNSSSSQTASEKGKRKTDSEERYVSRQKEVEREEE